MEFKDIIVLILSVIAIVISFITLIRTRKMAELAVIQSHIDMKYEVLSLSQLQDNRMYEYIHRIDQLEVKSDSEQFKRLNGLKNTLIHFRKTSQERCNNTSKIDSLKCSSKDELEMRETLGLLGERTAILDSAQQVIEMICDEHSKNA